jgi:diacylglycerol kinase family enzyme
LKAVNPLARFGRWNGSVTANVAGVAVSHQNTPKAAAATMMAARKIRRDIHRPCPFRFDGEYGGYSGDGLFENLARSSPSRE